MEIEKKFLLKQGIKIFANREFFPQMNALKKQIKDKGKRIIQSYLPLELLNEIKEKLTIQIKFQPNEIRLRKVKRKYTICFKSGGKTKRSEFEKTVSQEFYDEYKPKFIGSLEKYRLRKLVKDNEVDVDYYPKINIITCEMEVENENDLDRIPRFGKDISEDPEFSNKQLAK
ncbi:MAG: hypothetical protein PF542_03280 [Nanoarchaeota archaeon]|jgi:CYTH domain-containing protein|nr:hypothetical protein [Nanoarchaeota archaeon]